MNDSDPFRRASAAALRYLSYRPRSEAEVRTRLQRRYPPQVVQQVLADLAGRELIDDAKFAELWRDSRASSNPKSASAIKRELKSKGIAPEIAAGAVRDLDDLDSAFHAGRKFARRLARADSTTFRRKLWGYLQRRGFGASVSRSTIARLWDEQGRGETEPPPRHEMLR